MQNATWWPCIAESAITDPQRIAGEQREKGGAAIMMAAPKTGLPIAYAMNQMGPEPAGDQGRTWAST